MKDLLSNLKENNQDFEFYPTTQKCWPPLKMF